LTGSPEETTEQKNAPELPIGRFLKSKSLGGNRVIFNVTRPKSIVMESQT